MFLVQDGQIVVSYNLGTGPTSVSSTTNIADGYLHEIQINIHHKQHLNISSSLSPTPLWECTIQIDESEEIYPPKDINVILNILLIRALDNVAFYFLTFAIELVLLYNNIFM